MKVFHSTTAHSFASIATVYTNTQAKTIRAVSCIILDLLYPIFKHMFPPASKTETHLKGKCYVVSLQERVQYL